MTAPAGVTFWSTRSNFSAGVPSPNRRLPLPSTTGKVMTDIPNVSLDNRSDTVLASPDKIVKVREAFGVDSDLEVPAFSEADERVPDLDPTYVFDPDTTMVIRFPRRIDLCSPNRRGRNSVPRL